MKYLLDSNVLIHAVKGVGGVRKRMRGEQPGDLSTSVVTLAELLFGALKSSHPDQARHKWLQVLRPFALLDFSESCAHFHADIRYDLRHQPIGERDLMIASIALGNGLTLVTHNGGEFDRIPGLKREDWY